MAVKLGTRCEIFIQKGNKLEWATTHPNREEGKLEGYLEGLSSNFIVGRPASRMVITRRDKPQTK